ncbi:MAG: KH domain-containing protein [Atopobiaceae bacterium]|jgi:spoIIIJ-associated protein|nr:KH domain-containing protein [Atopobiaceae bacterium]MCH4119902.1 KH domain-containing protein [Atopobiaceae bacterium]MCI1318462.1 KH domain-containing protein [Atopobiaceae bacterium]MCI1389183.1 KH domain-containing protein [Atopobiaceae bacterium]MCI1432806.1 KH domain-containing protein [Atopobiaceae bacterium]
MDVSEDTLATLKEHYESGQELTDEELDLIADTSIEYLRNILGFFGETSSEIDEYEGDEGELILDVNGGDLAVLIGRHGKTLDAMQSIMSSLVNVGLGFHYPVVIDIEGYKNRRRAKIQQMAHSAAERAKRQHEAVRLPHMNAYERRIAHMTLAQDPDVTTHSEGEDPNRSVVITPLKSR